MGSFLSNSCSSLHHQGPSTNRYNCTQRAISPPCYANSAPSMQREVLFALLSETAALLRWRWSVFVEFHWRRILN